jgi:hypothetical protein
MLHCFVFLPAGYLILTADGNGLVALTANRATGVRPHASCATA